MNSSSFEGVQIIMLFTGWEVCWGKTVPEVLSRALGLREQFFPIETNLDVGW